MTSNYIKPEQLNKGDLFTIRANPDSYQQGKIAHGKIFRCRVVAYPFVYADLNVNYRVWSDSPWIIDLEQGIELISLPDSALYVPTPKKPKTKKKK